MPVKHWGESKVEIQTKQKQSNFLLGPTKDNNNNNGGHLYSAFPTKLKALWHSLSRPMRCIKSVQNQIYLVNLDI